MTAVDLDAEFKEVFDDKLGKLPGMTALRVKPGAVLVVMDNQRTAISVQPQLKQELKRLNKLGVIKPVERPTPRISHLVITKRKNDSLRICLDHNQLNKELMREYYTIPILKDALYEMKIAKIFTKADLSSGYWYIKLDEAPSDLTAFQTSFGRIGWRRLPFGLNSSAEIFHKKYVGTLPRYGRGRHYC